MQTLLPLEQNECAAALANGTIRIEVDEPSGFQPYANFVGVSKLAAHEKVRRVHVISKPAGGEIRSYVIAGGTLRLCGPAYSGEWTEMDALVAEHVGAPLMPYRLEHSQPREA